MRSVSDKSCGENQDTLQVQYLFLKEMRAFYEVMWKHTVEPGRPK
jgi:hypothetical protein